MITNSQEFTEAVATATNAAKAYYDSSNLKMSDEEYDTLVEEVAAAKMANPDWDDKGITTLVAAGQSTGGSVTHPTPMLSMSKSKETGDIASFVNNLPNRANVVVEPKFDGVAIRAEYVDGVRTLLATRGDGQTGELIASNTKITGLPETIEATGLVEIRGEVIMTDEDFSVSNAARVAAGKPGFANPRNAVAGTLRRETHRYVAVMSFAAYDVSGEGFDTLDSYVDRMAAAGNLGVITAPSLVNGVFDNIPTSDADEVIKRINALGVVRAAGSLSYGIDGAVVKVVSIKTRNAVGVGTRAPKWASAFKYAPVEGSSYLSDIEVAVGRTGRMSVTGILNPPVFIDGSTVSRATLHHTGFIAEQHLGLGSKVIVEKRGDIIPRITAALDSDNPVDPWTPPEVHEACGEPWDKSEVIWRCNSPECSTVGRITYAASRDVLDVDGLGEEVATALVESGLVNNIADLFNLTVTQVAETQIGENASGTPRVIGVKNATKIVDGITAAKDQPLARVLTSTGIRKLGRTMGRRIASHFKTLEAVRNASLDDFTQVEGVAVEKATYYVNGFAEMSDILDRMVASGVTTSVEQAAGNSVDLTGKTYVVSGSVPGYTRTTIAERIEALGGKASGSVSAKTTALVTSETTTSKAKKAASLNIPIIDPDKFAALIAE